MTRSSARSPTQPGCGRHQPIGAAGTCRACQLADRAARELAREAPRPPAPPPDDLAVYGQAHGWTPGTLRQARRAVTAVLAGREQLGEPPWDAARLREHLTQRKLAGLRAVEFLTDCGLARPDRAVFTQWLTARLAEVPPSFAADVSTWAESLQGRGPRSGPARQDSTIQGYLRALQPPLASWSERYDSLRQVTTDDLAAELAPLTGATRLLALSAMRSLFTALKARRVVFANPAAPLTGRRIQPPPVLPLDDSQRIRLLSRLHDPAAQLIVLLAGVHALRTADIRALALDDVGPAAVTLLASGHTRPLDQLTTGQLRAWLQARRDRWPATANPHLLVNRSTAGGTAPVSRGYIQNAVRQLGITTQNLRADRLHAEAEASGGDPLHLTNLFGISDPTAIRYCAGTGTMDPPTDHSAIRTGR
jgi:integrase